jgi:deazaflavin-dependent oxidoreductase (nitroreductase family)
MRNDWRVQAPEPIKRTVQKVAASDGFARFAPTVIPPLDRAVSKLTRGRVMLSQWMVPSIVLTTTGARSGEPRRTPLATIPLDGDLYVVGSNFGTERHPAWSYNLIADPTASVTYEGRERQVSATLLDAESKQAVWPRLVEVWPLYDRYVERSGRDLRVFRLSFMD